MTPFDRKLAKALIKEHLPLALAGRYETQIMHVLYMVVLDSVVADTSLDVNAHLRAVEEGKRAGRLELQAELRALLGATKENRE